MKNVRSNRIVSIFTTLLFFTSCEGYRCAEGVVKDKVTNLPLEGVYCNVKTGAETMYTDVTGKYELCNEMAGCTFGCKDITIEFSKSGYKTVILTNEESNGTIYLEK